MEEIGSGLNQSMSDIFKTKSPLAKKRDKLQNQIQLAKEFIKEINIDNDISFETVQEYLNIFYTGKELEKQITRLRKISHDNIKILTSMYSLLAHRMEMIEKINQEIQSIVES